MLSNLESMLHSRNMSVSHVRRWWQWAKLWQSANFTAISCFHISKLHNYIPCCSCMKAGGPGNEARSSTRSRHPLSHRSCIYYKKWCLLLLFAVTLHVCTYERWYRHHDTLYYMYNGVWDPCTGGFVEHSKWYSLPTGRLTSSPQLLLRWGANQPYCSRYV